MKIRSDENRQWAWVLAALMTMWIVGCGESDPCDMLQCGEGWECVDGACVEVGTDDCNPPCGDGELCHQGRCVSAEAGCEYHGQSCRASDAMQWHGDYLCLDWEFGVGEDAVCSQDCRMQACPEGSQCFLVALTASVSCSTEADCGEQETCVDGQCLVATCRPSECDVTEGSIGCGEGERCDRIGTGADICIPEGLREPGDSCLAPTEVFQEQRYSEGCVRDAVCVGGICRKYCEDGQCPGGDEECHSRALGEGVGQVEVCAPVCDRDDPDSCGPDEFCAPAADGTGMCQPAGQVEPFETCSIGSDDCEEGSICAQMESGGPLGRCLPACDLSVGEVDEEGQLTAGGQSARDTTCPQPSPPEGLWMAGHLAAAGEAVDLYVDGEFVTEMDEGTMAAFDGEEHYQRRGPGTVNWAVRDAGAPSTDVPLAEGEFFLDSGESRMVLLTAVAGEDRELSSEVVEFGSPQAGLLFVQGIPDLEPVDLWAMAEGEEEAEKWIEDFVFGDPREVEVPQGVYDVWMVPQGEEFDAASLVEYDGLEIDGDQSLVAFGGTMDISDIHGPTVAVVHDGEIPAVEDTTSLALTCRAVNDGTIGGCMERCEANPGLDLGRCQGEAMGCGPRFHDDRGQWTSVCQPVGDLAEGDPCHPDASVACGEGLYCEIIGDAAEDWSQFNQRGRCARLCPVGDDDACGAERACRPVDGSVDYDVGECRVECEPDGSYADAQSCPSGLDRCLPEAYLVPAAEGAVDVEDRQPVCWAAGTDEIGQPCTPGNCVVGSECLFERSEQWTFVESLLSSYMPTTGAMPQCVPTCDPFTEERSDHQCADGETCLFNFPWNANVGHCTEIVEEQSIGDACNHPGLSCGEDSICVAEAGVGQCLRFCQFTGPTGDGYERSTCPMGYQCRPLIRDIGVCD